MIPPYYRHRLSLAGSNFQPHDSILLAIMKSVIHIHAERINAIRNNRIVSDLYKQCIRNLFVYNKNNNKYLYSAFL